ncbi:hypothetical protein [Aeromicrobium sp. IC_218]|uniref:hypothetical protein n=1 Tax=Aeromicrobium sp. IC_218 TaxID=2545468 RepID=UPI001040347F|nr:hypothetical protein [Aeromicrobium sp. IC_218]TCI98877.1 hypothetical protein E0W78_08985 [Aeromicrobium sp. IC_218]
MRAASWVVAGTAVAACAVALVSLREDEPDRAEYCVAQVDTLRAEVDLEQARWSSLMAAIAAERGLPARATTIAIATAYQESRIHNIDYGDRDSVGLFQQRPSQDWGTVEQIMDPAYATGEFFDALVKIDGYTELEITDAAQRVQRSAYPEAYADHEPFARALASSLMGYSPAAFSCQVNVREGGTLSEVEELVRQSFGAQDVDRRREALDYPVRGAADERARRGWRLAQFLVANAARLELTSVSFDGRTWTAKDSPDGWVEDAKAPADRVRVTVS